jgi:hypothetical protein
LQYAVFCPDRGPDSFQCTARRACRPVSSDFFPVYYNCGGLVISLLAATIAIGTNAKVSAVLFLVAVLFVFVRQILMLLNNRARDDEIPGIQSAGKRFKILRFVSVFINCSQSITLLAALGLIFWGH